MKKGYTDITMILDRSGSMDVIWADTIGGINTYLDKQKEVPGECRFSLVAFDTEYAMPYSGILVNQMPRLVIPTAFQPRGATALHDAVGKAIIAAGVRFAMMKEEERPETVLFCIVTDGHENSSTEFTGDKIKEMIEHQTKTYKWDFSYLGANQDAITVAGAIGIARGKSMTYAASPEGTSHAFAASSNYATHSRTLGSASAAFSDSDRDAQTKAGA